MKKLRLVSVNILFLLVSVSTAQAAAVNWTFSGTITSAGVFSTIPEDSAWTFDVTFDSSQIGVQTGSNTQYLGAATFSSAGYAASDITARIGIADSPNTLFVVIDGPDAIKPDLEFTNFPGTFKTVEDIFVELRLTQGIGSEDILDYLQLDTFALDSTALIVRTFSAVPPIGEVSNISVSAVPIPAAVWLFGSCLGMLGWIRRR